MIGEATEHPSFLALDGLRLGRVPTEAERRHVAGCMACTGHVHQQADTVRRELPAWLEQAAAVRPPPVRRPAWARAWWLLPVLPAVGVLLLLVGPLASSPSSLPSATPLTDGVREKAAGPIGPAVRVFIKRGEQVFAWDGRADVLPADRLRLELRPAGYQYVSVGARSVAGTPPVVLYAGELDKRGALLPVSFRVDGQGAEEVLSVILAREPIPPRLHAQADAPADEARTWRQIIVLPKQPHRESPGATTP